MKKVIVFCCFAALFFVVGCSERVAPVSNESSATQVDVAKIASGLKNGSISGENVDAMNLRSSEVCDVLIELANLNGVESEGFNSFISKNRESFDKDNFTFENLFSLINSARVLRKQMTGCNCYITSYNEWWIDPKNSSSGDHAVAWFLCNKKNDAPKVTTNLPWTGFKRNWMVWDNKNNKYQVFVDGWYYWPLRTGGWKDWEIFYTVNLQ